MPIPTLETSSLLLRSLHNQDAAAIFAYASNPLVTQFTQWDAHMSVNQTLRFIHNHRNKPLWAVVDKTTGHVIGECGFIRIEGNSAEIHCAFAPAYWGKGIAHQAMQHLIDFGFAEYRITTMHAWILAPNRRSLHLAQALQMEHATTLHSAWQNGATLYDVEVYCLKKGCYE